MMIWYQPFVLHPKLIIQELSRLGLSSDEEVLLNVKKDWNKWLSGIKTVLNYDLLRCVTKNSTYKSAEMHVFANSSREAYAVTCFGRLTYSDDTVSVAFLFGKCKMCPMSGTLTIPRLELVAWRHGLRALCCKKAILSMSALFTGPIC